jgi:hypothetical protein
MSASFLTPYLIAMVLLGSCAALVGALLYRRHRPLGAAIGFAVGIMISPVIRRIHYAGARTFDDLSGGTRG